MDQQENLSQLRQTIIDQFNKAELRLLCADLGVNFESLSGDTIEELVLSLVAWIDRRGRVDELTEAVQRRKPETKSGVRVYEHGRYNLANKFIGRQKELAQLDDWLADESCPMFAVIALGGTGKSALTWHWLEKMKGVQGSPFKLIIWHGFYETGQVDTFLADVLQFLGQKPLELGSKRVQLNRLLELLAASPALVVLDGAERLLRAYSGINAAYQGDEEQNPTIGHARECVDPVAADLLIGLSHLKNGSKTLMSSRLMPRDLLGHGEKLPHSITRLDLTGLDPEDAYRFFSEWGIQTTRAEINAVCAPLDYHPFCMALLAGYAADDFENPGDLRAAVDYDPIPDLRGRQKHILQRAYDSLPPDAQNLLGSLAAFRNAVSWETIAAVFGENRQIRNNLRLLERRGLVQRTPNTKELPTTIDLHPITRRYAYECLADPTAVHTRLIDYFKAVPPTQTINSLADLRPTIELYHHLTFAERHDEARELFRDRLATPLYFQLGAYHQRIELLRALFLDGEDKLPRLSEASAQGWTLNALASSYSLSGQPGAAVPLLQQGLAIVGKQEDKPNLAVGLSNLANQQLQIGALAAATNNLRRSIVLCQEIEDGFREAAAHQYYSRLLAYCGDWTQARAELDIGLNLFKIDHNLQGQGVGWSHRAHSALLQGDSVAAQNAAKEALGLANAHGLGYPVERDYVRAYWLLGWATLVQGNYSESQDRLDEALRRCRAINMVDHEPAILLAHARLAWAKGQITRSQGYAQQALTIAQRSGYVLDMADIHNHLAHLALDANDPVTARDHAQKARDYAFCDGPPYAYQSALDEAERILSNLPQT